MQLTFVHMDGSKKGQTEVFQQPLVSVGRDPSNQLVFDPYKDVDVSSRHAQFLIQGEQLMLQDLGSRNGTFLNGQRIGNQPTPVPPTAIVQFGDKGPKVQVTFKAPPQGPGKKTQMIQDLQNQMQAQQKQAAASKSKLVVVFLFLAVVGGGGFYGWTWWESRKAREEKIAAAKEKLPDLKKDADAKEAAKFAPDELKKAQAAEADAGKAKDEGKLDVAAAKYDEALALYAAAVTKAKENKAQETLDALQKALAAKSAEETKATQARAKELEDAKTKSDAENKKRLAELEAKLAAAKTVTDLKPLVDAALASNKVADVEKAVATVLEKQKAPAAQGGGDPQFATWLAQLQKHADDLKQIPIKLNAVADASKPVVVAIQTTAYAIPKGQTEKTTAIRELVAYASGTGFLVTKDKIATTKELVEPWKFDPAALALAKKWDALGYVIHTRTDVLTLDATKVYTTTATTNPESDAPSATVIFKGADAFVDKPVDQPIVFKGANSVEQVQPHKRESGNVAVIQLKAPAQASLAIGTVEPKPGDQVAVLVQQKVPGSDQLGLYVQLTEIANRPGSGDSFLGVGGYNTWSGGPVLNPDGQVVGLIDEVQGEWMRMIAPARIKEAAGLEK